MPLNKMCCSRGKLEEDLVFKFDQNEKAANIIGSSQDNRNHLARYKNVTGKGSDGKNLKCARLGCGKEGRLGGHVWVKGKNTNDVTFIVPLCSSCNNTRALDYNGSKTEWFKMKKGTVAITSKVVPEMFTKYLFFRRRNAKDSKGFFAALFSAP